MDRTDSKSDTPLARRDSRHVRRISDKEVEERMIPLIVEAIYPVLIPVEQQDMAIQARNHARMTKIARSIWQEFTEPPK